MSDDEWAFDIDENDEMDRLYPWRSIDTYDDSSPFAVYFRQGCVADAYWFKPKWDGCLTFGQMESNETEPSEVMHVCNPVLFHRFLGEAIERARELWPDAYPEEEP